jgi:hypothetical protein
MKAVIKGSFSCANPSEIALFRALVRNGRLKQRAASYFLFVRDIAKDDLVGWIDQQLSSHGGIAVFAHSPAPSLCSNPARPGCRENHTFRADAAPWRLAVPGHSFGTVGQPPEELQFHGAQQRFGWPEPKADLQYVVWSDFD